MIITISGKPGSGKSTVAEIIAKRLKLKHYSMGDMQRGYAKEKGITIEELGLLESKDDKIDLEVDAYQKKLSEKEDNFVIDSRLGFHFIPHSKKVFLECQKDECAKRIYNDTIKNRRDSSERKAKSIKDDKRIMEKREKDNQKRFLKYYQTDFLDKKNYDIIVDTTDITAEEAAEKILKFIKKH
jgi:predicted cytidylate kinase